MYWYLSFLRPPPVSAPAGGSITITPQIANDLRTEIYPQQIDIYYTFTRSHPPPKSEKVVRGKHLTRWDAPKSQYAPINVQLPDKAKAGERWRIGLSCEQSATTLSNSVEELMELSTSSSPGILEVWSEGIEILPAAGPSSGAPREKNGEAVTKKAKRGEGKPDKDGAKQQRIEREFHWSSPTSEGGTIEVVEQTSFDLDKKLWDSGVGLGAWLFRLQKGKAKELDWPIDAQAFVKKLQNQVFSDDGDSMEVLELGSGTGFLSICFAKLWQELKVNKDITITATDLPSAMELLEHNITRNELGSSELHDANGTPDQTTSEIAPNAEEANAGDIADDESLSNSKVKRAKLEVRGKVLDWDEPLPTWVGEDPTGRKIWPGLIIASDVTYNTASFPSLVKTLVSLLRPSDRSDRPQLLLGYKERDPGERELWSLLEEQGIRIEEIDTIKGAEDYGYVEIWVGSAV